MKNYLLLIAAVFALAFTSCDSKDDDGPPSVESRSQLLTGKKWVIVAETTTDTDSAGSSTYDSFVDYEPCQRDNTLFFATNGTVTFDEEANVCQGATQTDTSTWMFVNNETEIVLGTGGPPGEVVELTKTKLVIRTTYSGPGITSVITTTFAPQ